MNSRSTLPGCGGLCIRMPSLLVVILIVDKNRILPFKGKGFKRQLPFTFTVQWPLSSPRKGCSPHPGAFMSLALLALLNWKSWTDSLAAWEGCIPALLPGGEEFFDPPVPEALITRIA